MLRKTAKIMVSIGIACIFLLTAIVIVFPMGEASAPEVVRIMARASLFGSLGSFALAGICFVWTD